MRYFKSQGITLISLVITIIVMLIIAGVVVSNVVGNNSSIEKAEKAKLTEEQRSKKDTLEHAIIKFNSGNVAEGKDLREFLLSELDIKETVKNDLGVDVPNIAKFTDLNGEYSYLIKDYQGEMAYLTQIDGIWQIQQFGAENLGYVASLDDNDVLIAPRSGDELDIVSSTDNYAIITSDDLEDVSFDIPANTTVSIKLLSNLNITNEGLKRAAINLNEGSVLNLTVEGEVTVNSTFGEDANGVVPGKGGYAGIRVPPTATLNLTGKKGIIKAIGGNAGRGGTAAGHSDERCAGGGGAGAGIGGNGGKGGVYKTGKGASGEAGESCGTVNITGSIKVYAYGGAGGGGGAGTAGGGATGGGAGGYPAAGIGGGGGGGAGGTCCAGGGGYTGGAGEGGLHYTHNGKDGDVGWGWSSGHPTYLGGGGYFRGGEGTDINGVYRPSVAFGGIANQGWHAYATHGTGFGGNGGAGGTITVSANNKIYAYNGNLYTDGTSYGNGANQCPIYLQAGIVTAKYDYINQGNDVSYYKFCLTQKSPQTTATKSGYINPVNQGTLNINSKLGISGNPLTNVNMSQQGVGSGAGYIEVSNGTYRVR